MRRHFLALEAFDTSTTGAPTDPATDPAANAVVPPMADGTPPAVPEGGALPTEVPDHVEGAAAATPAAAADPDTAPLVDPAADPAAAASVPPVEPKEAGVVPPTPSGPAGAGAEPAEPDEAVNVDPAQRPALPAEPGVAPSPVVGAAPTAAEPSAEPVPAIPEGATNAATPPADPAAAPAGDPAVPPAADPAANPAATPEPALTGTAGEPTAAGGESQPTPVIATDEADSEAMESLRERLAISIAMEGIAFEMADASELSAGISADLAESERVIQTSDALEDLAFVASTIEHATPAEAALMETAGNLAVAGTDVEPDAIIPAMEGYIGGVIATEGIKETAKQIWEAIVLFVDKIWEKIRAYWRIHASLPMWRKKIDAIRKMASTGSEKPHTDEISPSINLSGIMMGSGLDERSMPDTRMLDQLFDKFAKTIHGVFADYANGVVERGEAIASAIGDFDPNRPEKSIVELKNKLSGMHPKGAEPTKTEKLLGNATLTMDVYDSHADEDPEAALERLRNSGLKYESHGVHAATKIADVRIKATVGPINGYIALLDQCDNLLKTLEYFYEKPYGQMQDLAKRIKTASASATASIGKAGEGAMAEGKTVAHYRALLNFNKAFANWSYQPFVPLYSHALRTMSVFLKIADAGVGAYETKGAKKDAPKEGSQDAKPAGA